jgi:hypothetical protein
MRSSPGRTRAWSQSRGSTGAFASLQRASLPSPAVEHSPGGARRLGDLYWHELDRSTFGLVRARVGPDGVVLRPLGIGPALLRFGRGEPTVTPDTVTCRYAILGGLLARKPGGSIAFTQTVGSPLEVRSEIDGFFPRLATRRVRRGWSGVLYPHLQTRVHVALGRRYFARLRNTEAAR